MNQTIEHIVLHGCGGFAVEIASYCQDCLTNNPDGTISRRKFVVTDVVSDTSERLGDLQKILGYSVKMHSEISGVPMFSEKRSVIGIGSVDSIARLRKKVFSVEGKFASLIHPSCVISPTANLGDGCVIAPYTFLGPFCDIGDNTILNVHSTVGHDVRLGVGVIVSPSVQICGASKVGDFSFLGAGVLVNNNTQIGSRCKVASGVTVSSDIPDDNFVFNRHPAKKYKVTSEA
ncbi:hypothetical protein OAL49_01755 [Gammaproteobacteria bacterium]|nr:hypothetical protein [Gammaproteobacteria bacterium]